MKFPLIMWWHFHGGIVAGCYAAGMSPEQIEELMLKENLLLVDQRATRRWIQLLL